MSLPTKLAAVLVLMSNASVAAAGDLLPVPGEAVFAPAEDGAGLVAGGDGAALVACRTLLIRAEKGVRVLASCGADGPAATLEGGGFVARAGSTPASIRLGETVVLLQRATLTGAPRDGGWTVTATPLVESGSAVAIVPAQGSRLLAPEAAGQPAETRIPLPAAAPRQLGGTTAPGRDPKSPIATLQALEARIAGRPEGSATPVLKPRAIEDPGDFAAGAASGDLSVGALELDAIEVEVGCVEICVD
jgi:hypothetical protein